MAEEGGEGGSQLLNAVRDGDVECVRSLLEDGEEANQRDSYDKTVLMEAAQMGNLSVVRYLTDVGADVNSVDFLQRTPLMYATWKDDNFAVVQFLVERGVYVNALAYDKSTPLLYAAGKGDVDVVRFLVESGAHVNVADKSGKTVLMSAAKAGKTDIVRLLVDNGANVNAVQNSKWTALLYASENGHMDVARLLIENGAAIEAAENNGWTSLALAARRNDLEAAQLLVQKGANVDAVDNNGGTSLMHAAWEGDSEMIRFLVKSGADVNPASDRSATPLMYATWSDTLNLENIKFLVECGANVNAKTGMDDGTALMSAAEHGDLEVVEFLVQSGANINAVNYKGWSPLVFAVGSGKLEVARFLAEAGADSSEVKRHEVEMLTNAAKRGKLDGVRYLVDNGGDVNATCAFGQTLLMLAAHFSHLDVVRFLIERGANVNAVDNSLSNAPLLYAVNLDVIQLLVESGADVNARNEDGMTSLLHAVKQERLDVIRLLVEAGADVNAADNCGLSSLFYGAENSSFDVVHFLVDSGADANAVDIENNTPLMVAARRCRLDAVQCLVNGGADVNAAGNSGSTALMYAADEGKFDVVQYLAQCGADVGAVDKNDVTMLMHAAMGGNLDVVRFVFKNQTDVKAADKDGWTPLMFAVWSDSLDVVPFLLENGADVNIANNDDKTAAYIASSRGHTDIQQLLMQFKPHVYKTAENTSTQTPANCFISPFEVKLHQFVGTGNVGGNYRAKWLDADVAVKLFVPDAGVKTFADEVAVWHQLRHPNVIKLYGACDVGHHFFVCEWASNGTLVEYLRECGKRGKYRTPWKLLHEAALGLAYLHERKIVHGNLCSNSILVGSDGLAKLADFGVSGSMKDGSSGYSSARWQSPEQLRGEEASFSSDIYSFCLCAVEAVTGEVPWGGCDDDYCKYLKAEWNADTHPDDYFAPVQFGFTADLCALASKMCGDDPNTRVSASVVVQMLERSAAREVQEQQCIQSNSEPLVHVNDYKEGDLSRQWQKLQGSAALIGVGQPHQAIAHELEILYESLGNANRQLKVLDQFDSLVMDCICAIDVESQQNRILRLSCTRAQGSNIAAAYRRIDAIWAVIDDPRSISEERQMRREEQHAMQTKAFVSEVSQTLTILDELETEDERNAFVAFLKKEIDCHGVAYPAGELAVLKKVYADIITDHKSDAMVPTPKWFLPWYELEFNGSSYLAEGAFGTVYRAKWLESDVVVKQLKLTKSSDEWVDDSLLASTPETDSERQARREAREMFEREVEVWFGLSHPHVVRLFGACHVGNPFFACEYASNGSFDKYLRNNPDEMWQKLHEAALGVQYLHSRGLIHGDLKCNNIVVGSDHKAKVTDFGLSSANVVTGAWRWVAPECLKKGPSALSLASDIYAFGMCIVEALRIVEIATMKDNQNGCTPLPWGNLDNNVVKYRVTVLRELPKRPQICTDDQWELMKRMCAYDRSERIKISTVVDELAALAGVGLAQEPEPESAKLSRDQVAGLLEGMKRCCHLKQQETLSTNQIVLRSVYGLLWDRLEDLCGGEKGGFGFCDQLEVLVGYARANTQRLEQSPDTLTGFTEMAMNGYALHRELDKAIHANFWQVNSASGEELHDWRSKCYAVLGAPGFQEHFGYSK